MNFTVDRSKWRCGGDGERSHGTGETLLLCKDETMCCLGHVALQLGYTAMDIIGVGEPDPSGMEHPMDDGVLIYSDDGCLRESRLCADAININDDEEIDDQQRERLLKDIFAKHGHKIEFTGEFPVTRPA